MYSVISLRYYPSWPPHYGNSLRYSRDYHSHTFVSSSLRQHPSRPYPRIATVTGEATRLTNTIDLLRLTCTFSPTLALLRFGTGPFLVDFRGSLFLWSTNNDLLGTRLFRRTALLILLLL